MLQIEVQMQTSTAEFRLSWPLAEAEPQYVPAQRAGDGSWKDLAPSRLIAHHTIVELAVPFKDLGVEPGQTIGLSVVVLEHGLEVARYPHQRPATLTVPDANFEATMWKV